MATVRKTKTKKSDSKKPRNTAIGTLPEWDLSDLYAGMDDASITKDLARGTDLAARFAEAYNGNIAEFSAEKLAKAIGEYEILQDLLGKLSTYGQLLYEKKTDDALIGEFQQNIRERLTDIASRILFFTLAINKLEEADLQAKLKNAALAPYSAWLRDVRSFLPYQLADDMEKLLLEKRVAGEQAWVRLFDETIAGLRFPIGRKVLTEAEALHLLSSRDAETRRKAALAVGGVLKEHVKTFALVTNTLAKDKEIEDRWRGFARPVSARNVSNYIEDEVVDALVSAVREAFPALSHRYYGLKARWFGKKKLDYWDRNAPLPFDADRSFSWKEARELVTTAYRNFSPPLAEIANQFFDKRWIDAPVKPGKTPGAFSHPAVPSVHPYILMNFQGKSRDVMTLAHELGHGVHQVLSAKQGLMSDTPLTLAETASVFGEQLAFREMLSRETNTRRRKALIAGKVEDMLNTVVRQIAFCTFEMRLHDARREGEVTAERISDLWLDVQSEALGPAIKLHGNYRYFWTTIPHFIHSPFYVYAYAFGDCLVNALYAVYESGTKDGKNPEFEKKYLTMLQAGGTLRHKELLAPFGLDASKPDFWAKGLGVISAFIDELEE